jgi:hypothetical protein
MSAAHVIGRAIGATLLVCGAHFLVRALTGKTPFGHVEGWLARSNTAPTPRVGAGTSRDDASARENTAMRSSVPFPMTSPLPPVDPIDESSWESFPASDPPARSPKNA